MRIRIVSREGKTSVVDAETGEPLEDIRSVEFRHAAEYLPTAVIEVYLFDADLEADIDETRIRKAGE